MLLQNHLCYWKQQPPSKESHMLSKPPIQLPADVCDFHLKRYIVTFHVTEPVVTGERLTVRECEISATRSESLEYWRSSYFYIWKVEFYWLHNRTGMNSDHLQHCPEINHL